MGVYSTNRSNLGPVNVVAAEGYYGGVGIAQIMIESAQNDQTFFEAVIQNDFAEACGLAEGTLLESELAALNEANFGGMIDKIKEMLSKLLAKIKAIFNSFKAKIANVFIRDNKKFVEKYKGEVLKKDLSKMKYKYSELTGNKPVKLSVDTLLHQATNPAKDMKQIESLEDSMIKDNGFVLSILEDFMGGSVKNFELEEFPKEFHSYMFKDPDEKEGLSSSDLNAIIGELISAKNTIKTTNDADKLTTKAVADALKAFDKARDAYSKLIPGTDSGSIDVNGQKASFANKDERDLLGANLNLAYKMTSALQTAVIKTTSAVMAELKFGLAQSRRVFAQAVAYSPKAEAVYIEAVGDASDHEVETSFDDYEGVDEPAVIDEE